MMVGNESYLGNPLFLSNNRVKDFNKVEDRNPLFLSNNRVKDFNKVEDRVLKRLEGWKMKLLSQAGRTTLIKVVAMGLPQYSMSTFQLLNSLYNKMDASVRRF